MRDDARELIKRTLEECACGARTLDPVTEIDIALTGAGMQIVKVLKPGRSGVIVIEEEEH